MEPRGAHRTSTGPGAKAAKGLPILVLALAGAVLLFAAEFSTVASVEVPNDSCSVIYDAQPALADRCELSGLERHGGALLLLALLAGAAAFLTTRREIDPAATVLASIGAVAIGITLIGDLSVTNETGAIGNDFDGATAQAGLGFYLALTGGLLCLLAGILAIGAARSRTVDDSP